MAGFVDSLIISIGLDPSDVQKGLQDLGVTIDTGVKAAVENANPAIETLAEHFKAAAEEAEGLAKDTLEAGVAAMAAGVAGTKAGDLGEKAAEGVRKEVEETARTMRREMPRAAMEAAAGMERAFGRVHAIFSNLWSQIIGPLAGAFAVGGAFSAYLKNAAEADQLGSTLNADTEAVQAWIGAFEHAGATADNFKAAIAALGGEAKDGNAAIQQMLELAEEADELGAEVMAVKAQALGLDEATIEILGMGRLALDAYIQRQKEFGVYTKRDAEQVAHFNLAMKELGKAWDGLTALLMREALPAITKAAEKLSDLIAYLHEHPEGLAAAIAAVGTALAVRLLPPLTKLPALIRTIGATMLRWMPFVGIIMAIAAVVDDFFIYLEGGESALDDFWSIFGTGKEISEALSNAWKDLKQTGSDMWDALTGKIKLFWLALNDLGVIDGLKTALLGLGHVIHGFFTDNWEEGVQGAKDIFGGLYDAVAGPVGAALAYVGQMFTDMWNDFKWACTTGLSRIWNEVMAWLGSLLETVKNWVTQKIEGIFSSIKVPDFIKNLFGGADEETEKAGTKIEGGMKDTAGDVKRGFDAAWTATSKFAVEKFRAASASIKSLFGSMLTEISAQADAFSAGAGAMALRMQGGAAGAGARAEAARPGNTDASVHIGAVNVQTQAKDADGIARDMSGALKRHRMTNPAATGTPVK